MNQLTAGIGTEDFEAKAPGAEAPLVLTFAGAGTATLTGERSASAVAAFGFDDRTIGRVAQVNPTPGPGRLDLLGLGLAGLAAARRSKARK